MAEQTAADKEIKEETLPEVEERPDYAWIAGYALIMAAVLRFAYFFIVVMYPGDLIALGVETNVFLIQLALSFLLIGMGWLHEGNTAKDQMLVYNKALCGAIALAGAIFFIVNLPLLIMGITGGHFGLVLFQPAVCLAVDIYIFLLAGALFLRKQLGSINRMFVQAGVVLVLLGGVEFWNILARASGAWNFFLFLSAAFYVISAVFFLKRKNA
jgi:hypothetical protein